MSTERPSDNPRLVLAVEQFLGCNPVYLFSSQVDETRAAFATIHERLVATGSDGIPVPEVTRYFDVSIFGHERKQVGCSQYQPFPGNAYGHRASYRIVRQWWQGAAWGGEWVGAEMYP